MSHIDSYPHQLVGYLAGLPVYRALAPIEGDVEFGDFSCEAGQLVLGGGSGEWPGVVLDKPCAAVATFLALSDEDAVTERGWDDIIADWQFQSDALRFEGWRPETYHDFIVRCSAVALNHPFDRESGEYDFTQWLLASFGQFVFHALPQLAAELMDQLDDPWSALKHNHFDNILLPAPNAPTYANGGQAFHAVERRPGR